MADHSWQQRIRRAEHLAAQHPFAAEMLAFYIHTAHFQQDLYRRLDRASAGQTPDRSAGVSPAVFQDKEKDRQEKDRQEKKHASHLPSGQQDAGATFPPELPELLSSFPGFLALVEKQAPARLAEVARDLTHSPASHWSDLLNHSWSIVEPPSDPEEFLALAFLQPYAEFVRSRVPLHLEGYSHALCPFCSRKPALAVLRPLGEGARRNLLCGFCLCEWEFRRIVCANCDEKDHAKLPVYTAAEFPHIRVECCDACRTYLKSVDLSKNGNADPLVDELASVPLDLWAQEHGYAKLRPNLLGM